MYVSRPFLKALAANANTSSFAAKVATVTQPAGDGIVYPGAAPSGGVLTPRRMMVLPYGLGADNDALSVRAIGWRRVGSGPPPNTLWVPAVLGEFACTLSAAVGAAGSPVLNTERFADTITVVTEPTRTADVTRAGTAEVVSPGSDLVGFFVIDLYGFEAVEFQFDQTTNTPTMNALVAML